MTKSTQGIYELFVRSAVRELEPSELEFVAGAGAESSYGYPGGGGPRGGIDPDG